MKTPIRRLAPIVGALVFAAASAAAAWRLWRLRYLGVWIDESDNVVVGWLLDEGERLYATIFSHHLPLAYMMGQLVAALSPSDDLAHFRIVPILAYLAAGISFAGSPLAARASDGGWLAASFFVLAAALLAPVFGGTLLVTDVLWGCAFVSCAACLWLPLCIGRLPGRTRAFAGGAALALWVSGSLVTVYPLLALTVMLGAITAVSPLHRASARRMLVPVLVGALAMLVLEFAWLLRFGDFGGFVEQALVFNFRFYGPSQGYSEGAGGTFSVLGRGLRETAGMWALDLVAPDAERPASWFAPLTLIVSVTLGTAIARSLPLPGRWRRVAATVVASLGLLVLAATLRMRGSGFHSAPYCLWVLGAGAACVALVPDKRRIAVAVSLLLLGTGLGWPLREMLQFGWNAPDLRRSLPFGIPTFEYVRDHTTPDQRFLSLNVEPLAYLIARRHPAHPAVFYLPWQAAWERSRSQPDSCARVRENPPPYVYYAPQAVHGQRWESFGGCFDELIRERYEPVRDPRTRHLFEVRSPAEDRAVTR